MFSKPVAHTTDPSVDKLVASIDIQLYTFIFQIDKLKGMLFDQKSQNQKIISYLDFQNQQLRTLSVRMKEKKNFEEVKKIISDFAVQLRKNIDKVPLQIEAQLPDTRNVFEKLLNVLLSCFGGYRSEATKQRMEQKSARNVFFQAEISYFQTLSVEHSVDCSLL